MVSRKGFSIVEIIVALTILSVGLLGVAASGFLSARLMAEAERNDFALEKANALLDSLIANRIQGSGTLMHERAMMRWTASAAVAEVDVMVGSNRFVLTAVP